ncbi:MAG: hypothetical protein GY810_26455 [Aureispira sp.]|nr:hypothetical protein [Aureispira sp.]
MKRSSTGKERLPKDLTAFEELMIQLNENTQLQITDLHRATRDMSKELKSFAEKSIAIHSEVLTVVTETKRIDNAMQSQGQRQIQYEEKNNENIETITKQILEIEKILTPIAETKAFIKKVIGGVVTIVLGAASIAYFVGKQ